MEILVRYIFPLIWILHTLFEDSMMARVLDNRLARHRHEPRFYPTETNVTYEKGDNAHLFCSIENLGTKTVIWRKQPHKVPITVGEEQFVKIKRFNLDHDPFRDQWNLVIKNVQLFDAGTYECQISSKTKVLRRNITLNVVENNGRYKPEISITGTRVVVRGNSIYLTCNASGIHSPPAGIDWFKDGNIVTTEAMSDIRIKKQISYINNVIISNLTIGSALMSDTGTYVCRTSDLRTITFEVDVINPSNSDRNPDKKDKREKEALTHESRDQDRRGEYMSHSGQPDLCLTQLYKHIYLHHLLVTLYFVVH